MFGIQLSSRCHRTYLWLKCFAFFAILVHVLQSSFENLELRCPFHCTVHAYCYYYFFFFVFSCEIFSILKRRMKTEEFAKRITLRVRRRVKNKKKRKRKMRMEKIENVRHQIWHHVRLIQMLSLMIHADRTNVRYLRILQITNKQISTRDKRDIE